MMDEMIDKLRSSTVLTVRDLHAAANRIEELERERDEAVRATNWAVRQKRELGKSARAWQQSAMREARRADDERGARIKAEAALHELEDLRDAIGARLDDDGWKLPFYEARDGYLHMSFQEVQAWRNNREKAACEIESLRQTADAYDRIREELSYDRDVDPQEVIDAVAATVGTWFTIRDMVGDADDEHQQIVDGVASLKNALEEPIKCGNCLTPLRRPGAVDLVMPCPKCSGGGA